MGATQTDRDSLDSLPSWPGWAAGRRSALDDATRELTEMGSRVDKLAEAVQRASSGSRTGAPTAVLVFEEGEIFGQLRAALMDLPGVEVYRVDTPDAALQVVRAPFVRLLVVDVDRPGALPLIRAVRALDAAPVIAIADTASAEHGARSAGAEVVLQKAVAAARMGELAASYLAPEAAPVH